MNDEFENQLNTVNKLNIIVIALCSDIYCRYIIIRLFKL